MLKIFHTTILLLVLSHAAQAESYTYEKISEKYKEVALSAKEVKRAKMQGECLVGLKKLNFKKQEKFDAVAEWTNFRSISLLGQFSPCTVLVIMEVAQSKLKNGE